VGRKFELKARPLPVGSYQVQADVWVNGSAEDSSSMRFNIVKEGIPLSMRLRAHPRRAVGGVVDPCGSLKLSCFAWDSGSATVVKAGLFNWTVERSTGCDEDGENCALEGAVAETVCSSLL
jgi:hypothetical protein